MLNFTLDVARGLAALWVFFYHIRLGMQPGAFRQFCEAGFLGVPAFFVISGYCMASSSRGVLLKGQATTSFLRRRLRRIFPPYWASVVVTLSIPFAAAFCLAARDGYLRLPTLRWFEYSLTDWVELGTLTRGLFRTGPAHLPYAAVNSVYWTLAIEVQFYLVMTLAVALRGRFREVLAGVTVLSAAWYYLGPVAPGFFPIYWPMFAFGIALYGMLNRGWHPGRIFGAHTVAASAAIAAVALAGALALAVVHPSLTLQRQTYFAAACAAVLWAASGFEHALPVRNIAARAFSGLGKMSYTVYLTHLPLVALINPNVARLKLHNTVVSACLSVVLTMPMMVAFYYLFERRWAQKPRAARRVEAVVDSGVPEAEAVLIAD